MYKVLSIKLAILLFSIIIFSSSCKTKKILPTGETYTSYKSTKLFKKLEKSNLDYKWYSFKANASVFYDGNTIGGTADIRLKKDEKIWMSVKKFGFEIARVLIKPDSAFIINRFHSEYMAKSINEFKKEYDVPLDFYELQNILVGNSIVKGQMPTDGKKLADKFILKTKSDDLKITYQLDPKYKIINTKFFTTNNKTIEIDFSKYKTQEGQEIPYLRKYSYPNSINPKYFLNLKIKKVSVNKEQNIKFEVPKSYDKI